MSSSIKLNLQPRLLRRRTRSGMTMPILPHHIDRLARTLVMCVSHETTLVENLRTRRNVNRRILVKEIDRFEMDLHDLTRHHREILYARDMVDSELHPEHDILVNDIVLPVRPRAHARPAARLVRVPAARVQLAVAVAGDVDIMVGELGAFEVETLWVGEDLLEGRSHDLVADGFVVDRVADGGVLDFEGAVGVWGEVEAGGVGDEGFGHGVACPMWVPVFGDGHGVGFVVDEAVGVAFYHGVDA